LHKAALNRETRITLDALAAMAIYRMKELVNRKQWLIGRLPDLPPREVAVLRHISQGEDAGSTAEMMHLSETSVSTYLGPAQRKLKARSHAHAVALAVQQRMIQAGRRWR
jgi:DNA-binding CsgD family transcriptional regulator